MNIEANSQETNYNDGTLINLNQGQLASQAAAFDEIISSSTFLPRIQVYGSSSNAVKEEKINQGRLGLTRNKDTIEDLGKSLDCIPLSFRLKAMQIADGEVLSHYDHNSAEFKKVQVLSEVKDSGCMFGVEFLLWLPEQGEFVTFFLNSKSSRREAQPLRGFIGKGATIEVVLVKTKKHSWFAPKVVACSAPPTRLPEQDAMDKELNRFNNPKSSEAETASDDEKAAVNSGRD